MIHPDTELAHVNDAVGNGVFATRFIPRGTIVWTQCAFDIVLKRDQLATLTPAYRDIATTYGYVDQDGDTVLCWDLGRFVNHACNPAMLPLGPHIEICVRDLQPGDELTCDYGVLNYAQTLSCHCGQPDCRGQIRADDAQSIGMAWQARLQAAVRAAAGVAQPLLPYLRHPGDWQEYLAGTRAIPGADTYFFQSRHAA